MTTTKVLTRARPGTVGTHFLAATGDESHTCRAACYRASTYRGKRYISTLCDQGHSVSMQETGARSGFAGSAFQASLSGLPAHAPFILT